jgi:hypothetical protein
MTSSLRTARFWVGLALGVAAGLIYGWVLRPAVRTASGPGSLRQDYRTDYVLMVAEAYQVEGDLPLASERLAALGPDSPGAYLDSAMSYASAQSFSADDLERLSRLARDLVNAPPPPTAASP